MKIITLKEAVDVLQNCSAVIWADNFLCYPSVNLVGEDNNEFLRLSVVDDEGLEYNAEFIEKANQSVKVEGSSMFLIDSEGDEVQISILVPVTL